MESIFLFSAKVAQNDRLRPVLQLSAECCSPPSEAHRSKPRVQNHLEEMPEWSTDQRDASEFFPDQTYAEDNEISPTY